MESLRRAGLVLGVAWAALASVMTSPVEAVPRYSARYNQKCSLCHVNPSGGGLRTLYASQDLVPREIAWSNPKPEVLKGIDPLIAKSIMIGTDFRTLHAYSDQRANSTDFFQMQGDIYLAFLMGEKTELYYDRGMSSTSELFGLAYVLPITGGYVKVGRFVPSYGWRFDDHTMFVRNDLGFAPPGNRDVGVELGASPGHLDLQVDFTNGNRGALLGGDSKYAAALNSSYRFRVLQAGMAVGVSGYREPTESETFKAGGVHGYVSWEPVTWVGEADVFRSEWTGGGGPTGVVSSNEFSVVLHRGLEVLGTFDFYDPDRRIESGAKTRWGGGVHLMPNPFLTIEALYRRSTFKNGPALSGNDFYQTILQAHFLY